jgi:hypothetical protein
MTQHNLYANKEGGISGRKKNRARWAKWQSDERTQAKKNPGGKTGAKSKMLTNKRILNEGNTKNRQSQ